MAEWVRKEMPLAEWAQLQERFGALRMAMGGDEDLAMFIDGQPGRGSATVYVTGPDLGTIEQLAPGGWESSGAPSGPNVSLLVGAGDPWARFGIAKSQ